METLKVVKNNHWNANIKGEWIIIDESGICFFDGFSFKEEATSYLNHLHS